jgi:hypothetical protein
MKRTQARLGKFAFFESHIRATNAPALRNLNFFNYVKKLCELTRSLPLSSPFGPTFGYSISRLPRRSIV